MSHNSLSCNIFILTEELQFLSRTRRWNGSGAISATRCICCPACYVVLYDPSSAEEAEGNPQVPECFGGYGTQRRSLVTNAISQFKPTEENMRSVMSPSELLQGRIAGVSISTSSGNLGSAEKMSYPVWLLALVG